MVQDLTLFYYNTIKVMNQITTSLIILNTNIFIIPFFKVDFSLSKSIVLTNSNNYLIHIWLDTAKLLKISKHRSIIISKRNQQNTMN